MQVPHTHTEQTHTVDYVNPKNKGKAEKVTPKKETPKAKAQQKPKNGKSKGITPKVSPKKRR